MLWSYRNNQVKRPLNCLCWVFLFNSRFWRKCQSGDKYWLWALQTTLAKTFEISREFQCGSLLSHSPSLSHLDSLKEGRFENRRSEAWCQQTMAREAGSAGAEICVVNQSLKQNKEAIILVLSLQCIEWPSPEQHSRSCLGKRTTHLSFLRLQMRKLRSPGAVI